MQYKVLSASLERDEKIYKQGEYIEIESKKDAERLSSFRCILIANTEEVEMVKEVKTVREADIVKRVMGPLKELDTCGVRAKKKGGKTR